MKTPAELTYLAYCAAVGGKTFNDQPLPTFEQLGDRQKEGWKAAADSLGLPVKVGGPVKTTNGIVGTVRSISLAKDGIRGLWLEAKDSTGRPFEHYVYSNEIAVEDATETTAQAA